MVRSNGTPGWVEVNKIFATLVAILAVGGIAWGIVSNIVLGGADIRRLKECAVKFQTNDSILAKDQARLETDMRVRCATDSAFREQVMEQLARIERKIDRSDRR
jgi:hypothetical protein